MLVIKKLTLITFYLSLFFFPTQLGKHFWLKNSLLEGYRLDYLSLTIYFSDLLLIIYLLLFLINFNFSLYKKNYLKLILPFLILLFFQTPFIFFKYQQAFFLIKIIILLFYALSIKKLKPNPKIVTTIFSFQVLFLSSLSLAQTIFQKSIGGIFYFLGERTFYLFTPQIAQQSFLGNLCLRPYATFSHPNSLSAYLILITLYITLFLKEKKSFLLKKTVVIIYAATLLTLLTTYSQNSWLATLVIALLWIKKPLCAKKTLFLKVLLTFSFLAPFGLVILGFFFPTLESLSVRNLIFQKIFQQNLIQSIFGLGFFDMYLISSNSKNFIQTLQPVHNLIWQLISSFGILFTLIFYFYMKKIKIFSSLKITPNGFFFLTAFFLLGSFDHFFLTSQQNLLLLAFLLPHCFNTKI